MPLTSPRLWIVSTPIGNSGDLSPRAREILSGVSLVLAEDTRRTAWLFRECGISVEKLLSFFEHNEGDRIEDALKLLRSGKDVALVSDAGTPLVSDPGYTLVKACRRENLPVSPLPGPSAPLAALSAAGIAPIPHTFLGFLPRHAKEIREIFTTFAHAPSTLVFFERKDRLEQSLEIAAEVLSDRDIAICRELTKPHEEFILGELRNFRNLCRNLRGEITVIIGPPAEARRRAREEVEELLKEELAKGVKLRTAAVTVQAKCAGWSVKEIYSLANLMKNCQKAD